MQAARWLVVVPPNQRELYEILRQRLSATSIAVVFDRRVVERRRGGTGEGGERRRTDRRQRRPVAALYQAGKLEVYESDPRAATATSARAVTPGPTLGMRTCPECTLLLEFDMPRFPQQPARLEAHVIHVREVGGVEHHVEIQAFTVSGRPLLVHRTKARRPTQHP